MNTQTVRRTVTLFLVLTSLSATVVAQENSIPLKITLKDSNVVYGTLAYRDKQKIQLKLPDNNRIEIWLQNIKTIDLDNIEIDNTIRANNRPHRLFYGLAVASMVACVSTHFLYTGYKDELEQASGNEKATLEKQIPRLRLARDSMIYASISFTFIGAIWQKLGSKRRQADTHRYVTSPSQ